MDLHLISSCNALSKMLREKEKKHAALVDFYRAQTDSPTSTEKVSCEERLNYHQLSADSYSRIAKVLTDLPWMIQQEQDIEEALQTQPNHGP